VSTASIAAADGAAAIRSRLAGEAVAGASVNRPHVRVRNLVKRFRTKRGDVTALDHVSIDIGQSERVVLLGPSGCGKTTLLRCVAGLEEPDEGDIEIGGVTVFSASRGIFVPPENRGISMMFQSYALWPHMSVHDNVAYPLENRTNRDRAAIRRRVGEALSMVACEGLQARYPAQLSGGQQQRVALARAVVANDGIVLFDEPLSNVDAKVREQLRIELVTLQRKLGFAWLYVTHDQIEATAVADRIAVFQSGSIAQLGTPEEIYNRPASRYVAEFVGSSNTISGTVAEAFGDQVAVASEIGTLHVRSATPATPGQRVTMVFRPEHLVVGRGPGGESGPNRFEAQVEATMFLGTCTEHAVRVGPHRLVARSLVPESYSTRDTVTLTIDPAHLQMFPDPVGA
jgi:iron(III) transport system ATP-binding protein